MYNEGRNNFVRDTVIKILLVLLFVFLLIWLFPMPNLNPFYDRIFADNIKSMKEVAKSYYTVERLPKNIGDKEKLTLQEMLDKKMIIPFVDKDGKSCDTVNSYVEVVKMDTEYLFKTNLSCSGKTDYVVDYFGCYDICKDNSCNTCQKDVTEYEFKKTVDTKYVDHYICPVGFVLSGSKCVKTVENTDTKPATISCKSGYKYNDTTDKCEKTITDEVNATPVCPSGFVYDSASKKCLKSTGETVEATPSCVAFPGYAYNSTTKKCEKPVTDEIDGTPVCAAGFTYNTTSKLCERFKPEEINATKNCASGYTLNQSNGLCEKSIPEEINATTSCASGYTYNSSNQKCEKSNSVAMCASGYTYNATKKICEKPYSIAWNSNDHSGWICSNIWYSYIPPVVDAELFTRSGIISKQIGKPGCSGTQCDIWWYSFTECNRSRTCPSGYTYVSSNTTCKTTLTDAVKTTCSSGTISGSTCTTIDRQTPTYTCPTGYTPNGTKCNRTTIDRQTPTYTCPVGYTQNGTKCNRTVFEQAPPTYTCPAGYTQNGAKCNKTIIDQKTPTYTCPAGYTQNGTVCSKTTNEEKNPTYTCSKGTPKTGDATKCIVSSIDQTDSYYGCPVSYILNGKTCYKTSKSDETKDAEAIYKNKTVTQYTWSKTSTLAGWIATGKTRTTKVACDQ